MRDGVELEAWIFKPSHLGTRAPAILELTQYDIDGGRNQDFKTFVDRGYVFVQVEVRGRGRSGGEKSDNIGLQVGRDGHDAVEWIAGQPWSDGHVFMYGGSFVGMTQWHTAMQLPPHLSGIAPYVPIYPGWDVPNTNGIPQAWTAVILGYVPGRTLNDDYIRSDYWQKKMLEHYARQASFRTLDLDGASSGQDLALYLEDPLVFHSAPLPHAVEVAGHMRLNLIVQADAPDFDLWAEVQMVAPDGSAVTLGQDIRRARFRDGFFKQELLKPRQVVTIPFSFNWIAWRIAAGARIRLVLMPLDSPNYQKNYNTGGRIGYEDPKSARVAHITLFHDASRASALLLPLAAPAR